MWGELLGGTKSILAMAMVAGTDLTLGILRAVRSDVEKVGAAARVYLIFRSTRAQVHGRLFPSSAIANRLSNHLGLFSRLSLFL